MDMRVTRVLTNIKQLQLQKLTGINQARISAIENGHVVPTVLEMEKIEKTLGGPIDWGNTHPEVRFKRTK